MNKLLLSTILEITFQKEVESLQRTYLSAVMALYNLHGATIYKVVTSAGIIKLEKTINFRAVEPSVVGGEISIDDLPQNVDIDVDMQECLNSKNPVVTMAGDSLKLFLPIHNASTVLSIVCLQGNKSIKSSLEDINYITLVYSNFFFLINESERDTLTGLYNRRTFDAKLARMLAAQKTIKHAEVDSSIQGEQRDSKVVENTWLVTIDVDFFKRVNDQFGHVAGDEVLLQLSQMMKESFRSSDLLFRFGGEEFVIVLEPVPYDNVWVALERFRKAVESHVFPLVGTVTISTGFAGIREHDYPVTILDYADKALYFAKQNGRNCIHSYEKLLETGQLVTSEVEGSIDLF